MQQSPSAAEGKRSVASLRFILPFVFYAESLLGVGIPGFRDLRPLPLSRMPWSASSLESRIRSWLRDYDKIQSVAVLLIYVQIGCSLIGSLGALYNGVLLINLVVALFALVAIENNSQSLGRTYAALLACGILLDIMWFILFSHEICITPKIFHLCEEKSNTVSSDVMWHLSRTSDMNMSSEKHGPLFLFSLRLTLWMQIIGFSVRSLSSILWIQMYRLGVSWVDSATYREADFDVRNSFLNPPTHEVARQNSNADDILGGSIYDPAYYSSLFEDAQDKNIANEADRHTICHTSGSASAAEPSQLKSCVSRSFQVINVSNAPTRSQNA